MYHVGKTDQDRQDADKTFLKNMTLVVDYNTRFGFLRRLRLKAARKFYEAVQLFGGDFFSAGKSLLRVFETTEVSSAKKL